MRVGRCLRELFAVWSWIAALESDVNIWCTPKYALPETNSDGTKTCYYTECHDLAHPGLPQKREAHG